MKRIYTLGTVQYVPGTDAVLIPLQQVAPHANAPLMACNASQDGLASLTPKELSDRARWSDREVKVYATAFVRQDEPDAEVYTQSEWAAMSEAPVFDDSAVLEVAAELAAAEV